MMNAGDYRFLLVARLIITFCAMLIACGLLFMNPTDVSMNIANGLLGGIIGYWFAGESNLGKNEINKQEITQIGEDNSVSSGYETQGAPPPKR